MRNDTLGRRRYTRINVTVLALSAVLGLLLYSLAVLHAYWAVGGSWGGRQAVPTIGDRPVFEPSPLACSVVSLLLFVTGSLPFAVTLLDSRGGAHEWAHRALLAVGIVFVARSIGEGRFVGFFKREKDIEFARLDSLFYSPLCLALGCGYVALFAMT